MKETKRNKLQISPFEKAIAIVDQEIQRAVRRALFDVWAKHNNWGDFDEGDLLEIYVAVINAIAEKEIGDVKE